MFSIFVSLSLIQLSLLCINLLNPSLFKEKKYRMLKISAIISLVLAFSFGGLDQYIHDKGPYGTPIGWAQAVFWSINSVAIAVSPLRKKE